MAINDVYQLSVDSTLFGVAMTNVHLFQQTTPDGVDPPAVDLIEAFQADIKTSLLACVTDDFALVGFRAIRVFPGATQVVTQNDSSAGTILGEACPANVAGLSSFYAMNGAKRLVGRSFQSGIQESSVVAGLLDSALRVLFVTYLTNLIITINDGDEPNFIKVLRDPTGPTFHTVSNTEIRAASRKLRSRTADNQ